MRCFVFQDWLTIRGGSSVTPITQCADSWLDLSMFQDFVFWGQFPVISLGGGTVYINLQTSPTKDESLFVGVFGGPGPISGPISSVFAVLLKDASANPLARWLRWQFSVVGATGPWDLTFRLLVTANAPGRQGFRARSGMAPLAPVQSGSVPMHLQSAEGPWSPSAGNAVAAGSQYSSAVQAGNQFGLATNVGSSRFEANQLLGAKIRSSNPFV
jgi:hypothetical protein